MPLCRAGNRSDCSITCEGHGCYAYYREPDGPCITRCGNEGELGILRLHDSFSISIGELPSDQLATALHGYLPEELSKRMRHTPININLELTETSIEEFVERLRACVDIPSGSTPVLDQGGAAAA